MSVDGELARNDIDSLIFVLLFFVPLQAVDTSLHRADARIYFIAFITILFLSVSLNQILYKLGIGEIDITRVVLVHGGNLRHIIL